HRGVGYAEGGQLAGGRLQANDAPIPVAGEPDHPLLDHQIVRVGAGVDLVPPEAARRVIEGGDIVAVLPNEPDVALAVGERIAWTRSRAIGNGPLFWIVLRG